MYGIERMLRLWQAKAGDPEMRRDSSISRMLREALHQALRNLQSLKMVRPDDHPDLTRLRSELLAATSSKQEDDSRLDPTAR